MENRFVILKIHIRIYIIYNSFFLFILNMLSFRGRILKSTLNFWNFFLHISDMDPYPKEAFWRKFSSYSNQHFLSFVLP